jgi:hypothetical protein
MADRDRRNPYVILGVPFGASGEDARAGFARTSRRLRHEPNTVYTQEDLTWALHQVEQILTDPRLAFEVFRVPASPSALDVNEAGVINPPPHPADRKTESDPQEWAEVRRRALSEALKRILTEKVDRVHRYIPYE